ncbi:MAG: glutamate synthase (NADPH), homotetrameric [Betaproteobacteria bacterium RIFCSPHIGHO2_12_FULL_69_13]|nr:MAG: glutamate synthase (NADPH), homotetrameric [Betaproteobacteria bacterium RIFCSPHIGHO2_12_FULL_69_13]OGA71022.1 MAG: glutamate synthase (NADPH), homotetrameric [Betaproteobacteria bacterium RIFCSPLOWO2_12_FULL_68_20]
MPVKRAEKTPMPVRDAHERAHDFREVNRGYTVFHAVFEAERCLRCQEPVCVDGCPVQIPIPEFIHAVAIGDMAAAAKILRSANPLPAICGRVCPQESQCEAECSMTKNFDPVGIGHLERYVADWERTQPPAVQAKLTRAEKIAVIGSGPSGLVCAGELARLGYPVTIYEALHAPGGVLRYGIPEFRLPKAVLDWEIGLLKAMGVEIVCNVIIGKTLTLDELFEKHGYSAVFIGTGAGLPQFLGIPGENLNGVMSANEFLTRINLMRAYEFPEADTPVRVGKRVAVIGAGNTAMDAVRTSLRMGAEEAMIVYRRSEKEMGARIEEYHHALEEGVKFHWLTNPLEILGNAEGWATGLKCQRMQLGPKDASGRARPIPIEGSELELPVDNVVLAIGTTPNPLLTRTTSGLLTNQKGCLVADEQTGLTSKSLVFAGGDAVTGAATVILAAGAGKRAAQAMHEALAARVS